MCAAMKSVCMWVVVVLSILYVKTAASYGDCVTPPMECPNKNITFWLYTRSTKEHLLSVADPDSIYKAPWVSEAPIKILIHGYTGYKDYSPNTEIRPAYLEHGDYNVISVDYNPIAREPCYMSAAKNTRLVGKCIAQLIDTMVTKYGFPLSKFHVIGFSLGGQTAGFVANYLESGKLDRITGLDPAMPLFVTSQPDEKLSADDARFVDVLHTNALQKGKLEASGAVDFYANGGLTQPGCVSETNGMSRSSCDHARAPAYYAESISSETGFWGTRCYSWVAYMIGWCEATNSADDALFGEYVSNNSKGIYFFSTNSKPPYAKGQRKDKTTSDVSKRNASNRASSDSDS